MAPKTETNNGNAAETAEVTMNGPSFSGTRSAVVNGNGQESATMNDQDENNIGESNVRKLRIMLLGCEDRVPYGPADWTAEMFLGLLRLTVERYYSSERWELTMDYVSIQEKEDNYPKDGYGAYDGVIISGSYNGAYEDLPWIGRLKEEIQGVLLPNDIPTLGVCFGHQVIAHSFDDGEAIVCPAGSQGGGRNMNCTDAGKGLFGRDTFPMVYTHGDMVSKIPETTAISLGGNDKVPIQAAAYYSTKGSSDGGLSDTKKTTVVTFQAHPEYVSDPSLKTIETLLNLMTEMGKLTPEAVENEMEALKSSWIDIEEGSLNAMKMTGIALGWFPTE